MNLTLRTRDGLELPGRHWVSKGGARAMLALVHGLGEHSGRYVRLAQRLNEAGIDLLAADLRGHGGSPGDAGRIERFDDYLTDADAIVAAAGAAAPEVPLFLMGHSLGGAIVVRWLSQRSELCQGLAGVVLSSAALKIGPDISPLLLKLAPLVARIAPGLRLQAIDPGLISRLPEEVAAYVNDPKVAHRPPPARTASELLAVMPLNLAAAPSLDMPLYCFHGTADRLTAPEGSEAMVKAWGGTDKSLRLWPGSYHETLNDADGKAVANELVAWLIDHANRGSA